MSQPHIGCHQCHSHTLGATMGSQPRPQCHHGVTATCYVPPPWGHSHAFGVTMLSQPHAECHHALLAASPCSPSPTPTAPLSPPCPPPCFPTGFSIEGPSQAKIECDDRGDGSCDVRYWPTEAGEYAVHVVCDDEDILHSPFIARIRPPAPDCSPDKVCSSARVSPCQPVSFHVVPCHSMSFHVVPCCSRIIES